MPRRRLAFAVHGGQPRATMNAAWRRLLPGLGGAAAMMGPACPVPVQDVHRGLVGAQHVLGRQRPFIAYLFPSLRVGPAAPSPT
jgi:hypothetical protein